MCPPSRGQYGRAHRPPWTPQALFEAGRLSEALPVYEVLAHEFDLLGAQGAEDALTCRIQAARCRTGLGQHQRALGDLQREPAQLRAYRAPTDTVVLEVRLHVGLLLRDVHRFAEAVQELGSLYNDLVGEHGPDSALVNQAREALTGIRRRPSGGLHLTRPGWLCISVWESWGPIRDAGHTLELGATARGDQTRLVGEDDGLDAVAQVQLRQDAADVALDRGRAEEQPGSEFGITEARRE